MASNLSINGVEPRHQGVYPEIQSVQNQGIIATLLGWYWLLLIWVLMLRLPGLPIQRLVPQIPLMATFRFVLFVRIQERTVIAGDTNDEPHNVAGEVHSLAQISFARGELMQHKVHHIKLLALHDMLNDVPNMTPNGIVVATPWQDTGTNDSIDNTRKRWKTGYLFQGRSQHKKDHRTEVVQEFEEPAEDGSWHKLVEAN